MHIDWLWGAFGGLLIGSGGALYLLGAGRIMGASGILASLLPPYTKQSAAKGRDAGPLLFVAGLMLAPWLALGLIGADAASGAAHATTNATSNPAILIVAGLLVGFGARLGSGCTSGHGVCGLSRLSPRSMAATAAFMSAGFLVMAVLRHGLGVI